MLASGGIDAYLAALGSQAGEDFAWVDMLWANPTPRRLAFALYESFVLPWASVPLAVVALLAATAGTAVLLVNGRRALALLVVAFAPYALFHLLFQETLTVRYALPVVPAVACLAVSGLDAAGRSGRVLAAGLVAFALAVALPGGVAYGRESHPAFRAIAEMASASRNSPPAAVYSHYALRRPLQAASAAGLPVVEPRPQLRVARPGGVLAQRRRGPSLVPRRSQAHGPRAHRSAGANPGAALPLVGQRSRRVGRNSAGGCRLVSIRAAAVVCDRRVGVDAGDRRHRTGQR